MKIKKSGLMWLVIDHDGELMEACDTKQEARQYLERFARSNLIRAVDQKRTWVSLWDMENRRR